MKKIISLVLAFVIAFSMLSVTASATVKTDCKGNCDNCPSIVVPGIGQSNVWALDENGDYLLDDNGEKISCFPAVFNIGSIVTKVLAPALLTLFTQHDIFLSDALCEVVLDAFAVNICDENGKNTGNIEVENIPIPLQNAATTKRAKFTITSPSRLILKWQEKTISIISHITPSAITSTSSMNFMLSFRW